MTRCAYAITKPDKVHIAPPKKWKEKQKQKIAFRFNWRYVRGQCAICLFWFSVCVPSHEISRCAHPPYRRFWFYFDIPFVNSFSTSVEGTELTLADGKLNERIECNGRNGNVHRTCANGERSENWRSHTKLWALRNHGTHALGGLGHIFYARVLGPTSIQRHTHTYTHAHSVQTREIHEIKMHLSRFIVAQRALWWCLAFGPFAYCSAISNTHSWVTVSRRKLLWSTQFVNSVSPFGPKNQIQKWATEILMRKDRWDSSIERRM